MIKARQSQTKIILRNLMQECGISESELARKTGLPQTTINRLLLGGTSDPRAHTLKPIADFFVITIGQLCGFEPIPYNRIKGLTKHSALAAWIFIPIITWDEVKSWTFTKKKLTPLDHPHWISTERQISEHSFALRSLSFMEPRFRKGSLLIIDPDVQYCDGHYVIVALDGITPTVRRILLDGSDTWLKAFDLTQTPIKLNREHRIYGTIVESRVDIYHDL